MIAALVYLLCATAAIACAGLLVRGYARSRSRLLLWSSACFVFIALNNLLLVVDFLILPSSSLRLVRALAGLCGVSVLVYGLVWHSRR